MKLKPCPFCGGQMHIEKRVWVPTLYRIEGHIPGCFLESDSESDVWWDDKQLMVTAWNRRAKTDANSSD